MTISQVTWRHQVTVCLFLSHEVPFPANKHETWKSGCLKFETKQFGRLQTFIALAWIFRPHWLVLLLQIFRLDENLGCFAEIKFLKKMVLPRCSPFSMGKKFAKRKKKTTNQEADALWQHGWFHDLWPNASPTSMLMGPHPTPSPVIIRETKWPFKAPLPCRSFISIHCLSSNGWLTICYQTFKYLKIRWCWESLSYLLDLFWGWRHLWHLVIDPQLLPPFEWFESHPFTTGPWLESGPDSKKIMTSQWMG